MQLRWTLDGIEGGSPFVLRRTSLGDPVKAVLNNSTYSLQDVIRLPAFTPGVTAPTLVWNAAANNYSFQFIALQLVDALGAPAGFAHLAWDVDKATAVTNVPAGTHSGERSKSMSCWTPEFFNTAFTKVFLNGDRVLAASLDLAYQPAILTDATAVKGRIYKLWAANDSTTTDIFCRLWVKD